MKKEKEPSQKTNHGKFLSIFKRIRLRNLIAIAILICLFLVPFVSNCAFAEEESSKDIVETTFFGNLKDDGKGCGVYTVLNTAIDILSIGIGILGVIGITVAGIRYLTAGGNVQQTVKAKRRIFEIIIGLVAYVSIYAVTQWLLPGGKLNTTVCQTISDEQLAEIRAKEEAAKLAAQQALRDQLNEKNGGSGSNGTSSSPDSSICTNCEWGERIAQTAELLAWPNKPQSNWKHNYSEGLGGIKKWSDFGKARPNDAFIKAIDEVWPKHGFKSVVAVGADCNTFVNVVLAYSGHDPEKIKGRNRGKAQSYYGSKNQKTKWQKVTGKPERGDVCFKSWSDASGSHFHTRVYLGDGKVAEAGHYSKRFGHIASGGCGGGYQVYRPL